MFIASLDSLFFPLHFSHLMVSLYWRRVADSRKLCVSKVIHWSPPSLAPLLKFSTLYSPTFRGSCYFYFLSIPFFFVFMILVNLSELKMGPWKIRHYLSCGWDYHSGKYYYPESLNPNPEFNHHYTKQTPMTLIKSWKTLTNPFYSTYEVNDVTTSKRLLSTFYVPVTILSILRSV